MSKQSEQTLENNLIQQLVGLGYEKRSKHITQSVQRFKMYLMMKPKCFYEKNVFISCTKSNATYEQLGMSRYFYNLFCHFVHKLHSCIKYLNCVTDDKQLVANYRIQLLGNNILKVTQPTPLSVYDTELYLGVSF